MVGLSHAISLLGTGLNLIPLLEQVAVARRSAEPASLSSDAAFKIAHVEKTWIWIQTQKLWWQALSDAAAQLISISMAWKWSLLSYNGLRIAAKVFFTYFFPYTCTERPGSWDGKSFKVKKCRLKLDSTEQKCLPSCSMGHWDVWS